MHGGSTIHLGHSVAGLNGGDFFHGNGDVDAVFGHDLVAGRFDHLGDGSVDSDGSGDGSAKSGQTGIELRIGLGLTFLQDDGSADGGHSGGTLFGGHFLAFLFIGDFLADDILGFTDIFEPGSAGLDLNVLFFGHTDGSEGNGVENGSGIGVGCSQKLRVGLG